MATYSYKFGVCLRLPLNFWHFMLKSWGICASLLYLNGVRWGPRGDPSGHTEDMPSLLRMQEVHCPDICMYKHAGCHVTKFASMHAAIYMSTLYTLKASSWSDNDTAVPEAPQPTFPITTVLDPHHHLTSMLFLAFISNQHAFKTSGKVIPQFSVFAPPLNVDRSKMLCAN